MLILGQMADTSPFVEHGWYDWVYWWYVKASYPEPKEVLGRWLGPSIDVGPAMTAKVLKSNGQVVHLSTYRALTVAEMEDRGEQKLRDKFDKDIEQ